MSSDEIVNGLTATALDAKWRSARQRDEQGHVNLRIRRALSWLERAERERNDPDAAFIFYWVAFNAAYSDNIAGERNAFRAYFVKILALKDARAMFNEMSNKFAEAIRGFIPNRYVFPDFWTSNTFQPAGRQSWESSLSRSTRRFTQAIRNDNIGDMLEELFDRLYVLRNQLLHGGATWQGSVNRNQVTEGAAILAFLVPHFINLMLDNPDVDWGIPAYPPVE